MSTENSTVVNFTEGAWRFTAMRIPVSAVRFPPNATCAMKVRVEYMPPRGEKLEMEMDIGGMTDGEIADRAEGLLASLHHGDPAPRRKDSGRLVRGIRKGAAS